ncbi:hypothetical protein KIH87_16400 [Paraneptunicella aestuarii]|uniref:hypothetical protein n=1 Tax=Paraneptunicella aestuarii TaxID=2831148 RepID=UPI001E4BC2CE|nr:hypothetical protein [Paraneptunicella aestuarii]UAA38250.1 hypothetical protein KIH87_16400 [Paraneptunicella aestuarii]
MKKIHSALLVCITMTFSVASKAESNCEPFNSARFDVAKKKFENYVSGKDRPYETTEEYFLSQPAMLKARALDEKMRNTPGMSEETIHSEMKLLEQELQEELTNAKQKQSEYLGVPVENVDAFIHCMSSH